MNKYKSFLFCKQQGYALVTSMLLLLVLTTLGVSMYSNVNVQEQMALNMGVKARTFIAADSLLQSNFTLNKLTAIRGSLTSVETQHDGLYDQGDIKIKGLLTVCFAGEVGRTNGNGQNDAINAQMTGKVRKDQLFQMEARVSEAITNGVSEIHQGAVMLMQSGNQSPNCTAGPMINP